MEDGFALETKRRQPSFADSHTSRKSKERESKRSLKTWDQLKTAIQYEDLVAQFSRGPCSWAFGLLSQMLRISSAASGEEVATLAVSELPEEAATIGSVKLYLARKHFQNKYSRFQLRIFREADPSELQEDESITAPLNLQLMLMHHLPPNMQRDNRFLDSCKEGNWEVVEQNLRALQNPDLDPTVRWLDSPLTLAAQLDHTHVVRLLLEAGANIEWQSEAEGVRKEMRALHHAAAGGHFEVVRLLLDFSANVEATNIFEESPLHGAVSSGNVELVQLLLDSGAEKEVMNVNDRRPLHYAANYGFLGVVRLLLDTCANKEAVDRLGRVPLHDAAKKGHLDVVSLLIEYGADKEATDSSGRTPSELSSCMAVQELLDGRKCRRPPSSS